MLQTKDEGGSQRDKGPARRVMRRFRFSSFTKHHGSGQLAAIRLRNHRFVPVIFSLGLTGLRLPTFIHILTEQL
jgi:hypothetical protein